MGGLGLRAIAVAGVVAVSAAGCSVGTDNGPHPAPSSSSSSSASATPTSSQTSTASTSSSATTNATAETSAGTKRVTVRDAGISFAVPQGWTEISPSVIDSPAARKALEGIAQKQGMSVDAYVQQLTAAGQTMFADPHASAGAAENINVLKSLTPVLPSGSAVESQLKTLGAKPKPTTSINTPLGKGQQTAYTMTVQSVEVHGVFMYLPTGSGEYAIATVTATSAANASRYAADVARSLQKS